MYYGYVTREPFSRIILHIQGCVVQGRENAPMGSPAEVQAYLDSHPDIQAVMFYSSHMPRRAVERSKVDGKMLTKLFRYSKEVIQ